MRFFAPGDHIAIRELWNGRPWFVNPAVVVEDTDDEIAFFTRAGAVGYWAERTSYAEGLAMLVTNEWELSERTFHSTRRLCIARPGERYAVSAFWRDDDASFVGWYVDIIDPLVRSPVGFDFRDLELDIVISEDLSSWTWKDEAALAARVKAGLHTPDEAIAIRRVGEEVIAVMERGEAWWTSWREFRPDLPVPRLPDGWDVRS